MKIKDNINNFCARQQCACIGIQIQQHQQYEKDKITTNTFVPLGGDGACIGTVGDDYQGYERGADGICVSHVQE